MTADAERLLADCLRLPDDDRAELAGRLIESLDSGWDSNAASVWEAEIDRRLAELDRGEVQTLTWAEARREILRAGDEQAAP
jgi:putative addiction module component (TIGR02574 family)